MTNSINNPSELLPSINAGLLPCPNVLCDYSRPFLNETDGDLNATHTWVSCENCGACGPRIENPSQYYGRSEEWAEVKRLAVDGWNTRTPTVTEEAVEAVAREGLEQAGWDWLDQTVSAACDEHPSDIAYSADQMIDAFIAGFSAARPLSTSPVAVTEGEGRVEVGPDDPLYKALQPSPEVIAVIERGLRANAANEAARIQSQTVSTGEIEELVERAEVLIQRLRAPDCWQAVSSCGSKLTDSAPREAASLIRTLIPLQAQVARLEELVRQFEAGSIDVSGTALIYNRDPRELLREARSALSREGG